MTDIKDSGARRDFGTGSVRDDSAGKGRFDLLPFYGLEAVARIMELGLAKYGERNWELGQPLHVYLDSAMRHLAKACSGIADEPHAAMAAWNMLCYLHTAALIKRGILPANLGDRVAKPMMEGAK